MRQQLQQQQQQQRQPQRYVVAGLSQQQQQQHQQQQQKRKRPKPDLIEISPGQNETFESVSLKIRKAVDDNGTHKELKDFIIMSRRTDKALLRLTLARSANATLILQQIRTIIGEAGTCQHVTEMVALVVNDIDSLVKEEELTALLENKIEGRAGIVSTSIWQMPDGTQRARIRLPAKAAKALDGTKLRLGFCISRVKIAPPTPKEHLRCYRCLEHGHNARDCRSPVDRQNVCIRCGQEGHKAGTCKEEIRCGKCGGPHVIGDRTCDRSATQ
uniref:uncharacterized protein LOC125906490 n=1 Tax=Anopheles coluzzii TaxID=1518534 RepID=UPI0020FF9F67|nr:uncharacterized protein LOC125906490 [Anopheles coluzzii]